MGTDVAHAAFRPLIGCALFALSGLAESGQEVADIPFIASPPGTSALGGGLRFSASPYRAPDNDEIREYDLVPLYLYNGKYVFFRGTSGGLHLVHNDRFELNLLGRYQFLKLDPDRNSFYDGINEREQTLEAGIQIASYNPWGVIRLEWLADTLNRHGGNTVNLSYRYVMERGHWIFSPYIGWNWHDENFVDYYFGVDADEARPDLPEYAPGRSESAGFGLNTAWLASDRITLFANVGISAFDSEARDSPLVDADGSSTLFVGGTYIFGNARRPESFIDSKRAGEWSWRVNYGYQADGNIVGEIDQGDLSRSNVAETNIGGITFAKLLTDGPRVDFWGKGSVYRHFESDEGNGNFLSYTLYIMAMGTGYLPWTEQESFRWGFGFGMSYADKVPIAEQRKQAAKGNNTSRFINYLELQLDFPLRRVFKQTAWLRNCYAGFTVVHRSGIFGTSDILGDVSGGSDWITAHFECTRGG